MEKKLNHKNRPQESKGGGKRVAFGLAALLLTGLIGYEAIWNSRKEGAHSPPIKSFIIPPEEYEKEQLIIELNHSLQKLNELKRLLFVRNQAPETTLVSELRATIREKESLLAEGREELLHLAAAGAERDDELNFQKTIFAIEKGNLSEKNRLSMEEIHQELADAVLQIALQKEREKLLRSTLRDIKEQYDDLKSREEKFARSPQLEQEGFRDVQQLFMFELLVDQIKLQKLQYELEELASALKAIEKERDFLRSSLETKIEELAFQSSDHEHHIENLRMALEEKQAEQNSLTTQIADLLEIQEEEIASTRGLKEELQKSLEVQKLLSIQLAKLQFRANPPLLSSPIAPMSKSSNLTFTALETLIATKEELLTKNAQEKETALKQHNLECEVLRAELETEKQRYVDLAKELETSLRNFEEVSKALNELQVSLATKEQQLMSLKKGEKGEEERQLREEIADLQRDLRKQEEMSNALKDDLEEAYTSKERAEKAASILENEIQTQEVYLVKQLHADNEAQEILQEELKELKQELAISRKLLIEMEALKAAMASEEERSKGLEMDLLHKEQKLDKATIVAKQLEEQLLATKTSLKESLEEKEALLQKAIELDQALENRGEQSKTLQGSLIEVNEKYQALSSYLDEQKESLSKLQIERDRLAEEVSMLKGSNSPSQDPLLD